MEASWNRSPEAWAQSQFGEVELGDVRRTRRAVMLVGQMVHHPAASVPDQTGTWAATKAGYRLLGRAEVTHEALQAQHWRDTRQTARSRPVVLHIQDTTMLDFTFHPAIEGFGPIGDGNGKGFLLHSTLAVDPEGMGEVLGLSYQKLFCRQPAPEPETLSERKRRGRESEVWPESVRQIGPSGTDGLWIQVCDRGGDNFEMFEACRQTGVRFLIRVAQDRRAALGHEAMVQTEHVLTLARSLSASGEKTLCLRRRPTREPREARLSVAYAAVTVFPPWLEKQTAEPLRGWVVRAWEPVTPEGEDPIEWVLLTDMPVPDMPTALTVTHWYALRWLVEEYHKCLKTGCRVEQRQMETAARLEACIGLLAVVATRLLQLKLHARVTPDRPALEYAPATHVRVLAAYRKRPAEEFTAYVFWREVAKLGGFLGRRGDGEPGWQTLWRGWQKLDLMTLGANLATGTVARCG